MRNPRQMRKAGVQFIQGAGKYFQRFAIQCHRRKILLENPVVEKTHDKSAAKLHPLHNENTLLESVIPSEARNLLFRASLKNFVQLPRGL